MADSLIGSFEISEEVAHRLEKYTDYVFDHKKFDYFLETSEEIGDSNLLIHDLIHEINDAVNSGKNCVDKGFSEDYQNGYLMEIYEIASILKEKMSSFGLQGDESGYEILDPESIIDLKKSNDN